MHPLNGALTLPYVPARVTRDALVAHRHSIAPTHCRKECLLAFSVALLK